MINKENDEAKTNSPTEKDGYVDVAKLDVQCHLLIKDTETGEVLVNKRG